MNRDEVCQDPSQCWIYRAFLKNPPALTPFNDDEAQEWQAQTE
jgi:hypothetical protein